MSIEVINLALSFGILILLIVIFIRSLSSPIFEKLQDVRNDIERLDRTLGDEFKNSRLEAGNNDRLQRDEVSNKFVAMNEILRNNHTELLNSQTQDLLKMSEMQRERFDAFGNALTQVKSESAIAAKALREEVGQSLNAQQETLLKTLVGMSDGQRDRLEQVTKSLDQLKLQQAEQQEVLRTTVEGRLEILRKENAEKLEQMRVTVDEKLQGTLEQRLGASFQQVSQQLEQVYKSVGEMQALATGVGDLKRVLTNVKTRGTWGEVSLGNLLEQVMTPDQFARNVEVKPSSGQRVEYAIKLPGADSDNPVWLPIDSKFPVEDYDRLVIASERGDIDAIEAAGSGIEARIRDAARDIAEKYVSPPHSTDFGLLFLPTEGLFAEVLRRPGLVDRLQRDYRINVTGPTTLAALLNSLRMGFRTLAIQKRSSEVWQVLGAVKTEFGKYTEVMNKVRIKLGQATDDLDKVATRHRAVARTLKNVETVSELQANDLLELSDLGMNDEQG